MMAADCASLLGAPTCAGGAWNCTNGACAAACPQCTDPDGDGYGTGAAGACRGADCDENDPQVHQGTRRGCYSGAPGTQGVGECRAGVETCTAAGTWSGCAGEILASGEACNNKDDDCNGTPDDGLGSMTCGTGACATAQPICVGGAVQGCPMVVPPAMGDATCDGVDDDCDGQVDEDCPDCVTVIPLNNATNAAAADAAAMAATATGPGGRLVTVTAFGTINAAIVWAAADPARSARVCVAAGTACNSNRNVDQDVVLEDGIGVYGGYESTTWTRCASVTLRPRDGTGVLFPARVVNGARLDGFTLTRNVSTDPATMRTRSAGVTVDGAQGAVIAGVVMENSPTADVVYGVNVINGATATVTASSIFAGTGSQETMGVRAVDATVNVRGNCTTIDPASGRCTSFCNCGTTGSGMRICGRDNNATTGVGYEVYLQNAPGSLVEANALCGGNAQAAAAIRVEGNAAGTVMRGNFLNVFGGSADSHGIWMEDCAGAAPWVVNNERIAAAGENIMTRVDGVRAVGDCHPVVDSNVFISGGSEGGTTGANGVHCASKRVGMQNSPSRCVVLGNALIQGSEANFPPTSVGVRCDNGGCMRIENNVITGRAGVDTWGVWMENTGAVVTGNTITGGCPSGNAVGVHADDAYSVFRNNTIAAGTCASGTTAAGKTFVGVEVVSRDSAHELVLDGNVVEGQGMPGACQSGAVMMRSGNPAPVVPWGVFRNNTLRAGTCNTAVGLGETVTSADPRVLTGNTFDPAGASALYVDEGSTMLGTVGAVNALTDIPVNGGNN